MATRRVALVPADRIDAWLAGGIGALAFGIYLASLPPSYGMWDTAELQTVTAILGIAHPPGAPAFTLLGYLFVHVFPFGEDAWRLGVMCSLCVALSAALAYGAARYFGVSRVAGAVCALAFAFSIVTWRDATRAETLDVALLARAAALFFGLRWFAAGRVGDLRTAAFAFGIACATHGLSLFVLPSLALLAGGRPEWRSRGPLLAVVTGFALGLTPYAYLPLRSAWIDAHHLDPLPALGLPAGLAFWNYGDPSTWPNFVHLVTAADFHVRGGFAGYAEFWRYPHFARQLAQHIAQAYGYVGTLLAFGGACLFAASRRNDRLAIVLAALLPVPYTESYTDLQDAERYYLLTFWCAAVLMAVAFERLADLFELRPGSVGRFLAAFALALTFSTVAPERLAFFAQRSDRSGPTYVAEVCSFTPDDAIVLADWSYATPLAYAGYVDRAIGHRTVVASSPRQYLAFAARWVHRRPVYFVGFDDQLRLPGWNVRRVKSGTWSAYRLTK